MPGCSASFCKNRSDHGFLMHAFPQDPDRREKWAEKTQRKNWKPPKTAYLCEAHFEDDEFELHRRDGQIKLKAHAVPTIFHYTEMKPAKTPRFTHILYPNILENIHAALPSFVSQEPWTVLEGNVCNVKNCVKTNSNQPRVLFPFPNSEERCRQWVERCQNEALLGLSVDELCMSARLCTEHFDNSQFLDANRETLVDDAVPSIFPHDFLLMPSLDTSLQEECLVTDMDVVEELLCGHGENEIIICGTMPILSPEELTFERLCASALQVTLPSLSWAVHKGLLNETVAFVHTRLQEPFIGIDKALVFHGSCRADVYFKGKRVLLGMGNVTTLKEIESLLAGLSTLNVQSSLSC